MEPSRHPSLTSSSIASAVASISKSFGFVALQRMAAPAVDSLPCRLVCGRSQRAAVDKSGTSRPQLFLEELPPERPLGYHCSYRPPTNRTGVGRVRGGEDPMSRSVKRDILAALSASLCLCVVAQPALAMRSVTSRSKRRRERPSVSAITFISGLRPARRSPYPRSSSARNRQKVRSSSARRSYRYAIRARSAARTASARPCGRQQSATFHLRTPGATTSWLTM